MTESRHDAAGDDGDSGAPPGMPRWVKIAAVVVGALVLTFVVLQLTGVGGQHGPGRHTSVGVSPLGGSVPQQTSRLAHLA